MQAASSQPLSIALPGFLAFFVALWCLVSAIVSVLGGWRALTTRFRAQSEPAGPMQTAGPFLYTVYLRNWTHYNSVVRVTAAQDALYLSVLVLFRFAHPPLRIPWEEITVGSTRFFWRDYVVLTLGREEQVPMRISMRMARNLGLLQLLPDTGDPSSKPSFDTLSQSLPASKAKEIG